MDNKKTIIIGVCGYAKSGKSTVSNFLLGYGGRKVAFADPIKAMCKAMGLSDDQLYGDMKEIPDHRILAGHTPRWAMQSLGTEWRNMINVRLWSDILRNRIINHGGKLVVIEDVRFDHEVEMLKELGAFIICVERPGVSPWAKTPIKRWIQRNLPALANILGFPAPHKSEQLDVRKHGIPVILNDGSMEQLHTRVKQLVEPYVNG